MSKQITGKDIREAWEESGWLSGPVVFDSSQVGVRHEQVVIYLPEEGITEYFHREYKEAA